MRDYHGPESAVSLGSTGFKKDAFSLSEYKVFFDFDNTITTFDILDDIIERFSINDDWFVLEQDWISGKIGSRACLAGQLASVRITKEALTDYLSGVEVDHHVHHLLALLKKERIKPAIVSDSFHFLIKTILANNGITGIKIYANTLRFCDDRLITIFPHADRTCLDCANCKKSHVLNHDVKARKIMYIGDGFSDVCPSQSADLVFAKGKLAGFLKHKKKNFVKFTHLGEVYQYLKEATT